MNRPIQALMSTKNLLHNVSVIRSKAPQAKLLVMVKANAYGHGICSVGQRIQNHVDMLGVASIDEALLLRESQVEVPVLLAEGVFSAHAYGVAAHKDFHVVVHHECQLGWLDEYKGPLPLNIWIKVDTGMGRLGFLPQDFHAAYERLMANPFVLKPIPIMSHLACADEPGHALNEKQIKAFQEIRQKYPGPYSLCNSAGIFQFPQEHHDMVRTGLALYGISPVTGKTAEELGLKPVMTVQSCLIGVKSPEAGSTIGYAARYTTKGGPIGVIACGYGDGYPVSAQDGTPILVNGVHCSIAGRISMDMLTVDLSPCPQAQIGDPVTLWGEGLSVNEVVPSTSVNAWRLSTGLQKRVPCVWDDHV